MDPTPEYELLEEDEEIDWEDCCRRCGNPEMDCTCEDTPALDPPWWVTER